MVEGLRAGQKDNSRRLYPGKGGRRHNPVRFDAKRKDALERNAAWAALGPLKQLEALDRRLGVGAGAAKQRARLASILERATASRPAPVAPEPAASAPGSKAKDRRTLERAKSRRG